MRFDRAFWSHVAVGDGCWEWTGARDPNGYGRVHRAGVPIALAHRFALAQFGEALGDVVLHRCDNPGCVRPDHLRSATQADNCRDAAAKGRTNNGQRAKTHCPLGHPYDDCNTYRDRRGRQCRACRAERQRAARARRK